jgi:ATP-dependent helicase/nuclease subunit B
MAVQFILGRSGTGKTGYCIKAITDALTTPGEQPLILLVPEQATYQAERAILSDKRIGGYHRLNVLSFDRLQFLLLGKNTARPALSNIGRQMIIHRILQENKDKLELFDSSMARPGLSRQMAQTISELHRYAETPDDIERLLNELRKDEKNNITALKFADIGLILREYLKFVEDDFSDPDVQVTAACKEVPAAAFAKGARLWVDGFAGFADAELALLAELLKAADDTQIALCLEPSNLDLSNPDVDKLSPVSLFSPTEQTYCDLFEIIKKNKLPLAEPIILKKAMRFSDSPQLGHIEKYLFRHKAPKLESADDIHLISAPNERAEVRFVAKTILQLVRRNNYRYRDIAVIASDIDRYQHYIESYFEDYEIPFFIDKRKPLNRHPVIQLISSALQAVTGGFSNSDIFACLKTDLVPISRYEIDLLENYCIAFGISAIDWQSSSRWEFAGSDNEDFDEKQINRIRKKAIAPFLKLYEKLGPGGDTAKKISAQEFTQILFDFLDDLKVRETIADWIEEAEKGRDGSTVEEHQQLYNKLVDIFDELVEVFGGHTFGAEDYYAIIESAFSQLTLAFIPPTLDQVLVGSIERSRHPDLKAVFLIGATQKQFPVPIGINGILSDDDRWAAESADFSLAATSERTLAERQYLAYIAFTRPSELLYITCPCVDDKGGDIQRSQFIFDIESLFENLREESIADKQIDFENIQSESELTDLLCEQLGRDVLMQGTDEDEKISGLLDDICLDERLARLGANVRYAIDYDNNAQLDTDVVEEYFEKKIKSSATRLSTFAACPYQHFARYILELKERKEFKLEPLDLGSFYHSVLDVLVKRLNAQKKDFVTISDNDLINLLKIQIEKVIKDSAFLSHFVKHRGYNEFIIRTACDSLQRCVLAVAQMVRAGSFRPKLSEVSFGQMRHLERSEESHDTIGEYEIALADGRVLSLAGKIDRLDFADIEGATTVLVLDYKRRSTSFSFSKFYHGLDMQLPIYMLAVVNASGAVKASIAGAFYMPVEANPKTASFAELPGKAESFEYKAKGIFNGKYFKQLDNSAESGWNKYYSFCVTSKDGQYGNYAKSSALRPDDFKGVLTFAERKIVGLALEIISGKIEITPYRIGTESPCSFCKYASVCRFDWQINDYNVLEPMSKLGVLEKAGGYNG